MSKNKVEITGLNTSKIPTIKSGEMRELFIKFKNGDQKAKDDLVFYNLKLVLSILRKFHDRTDNMDDLFQIGVIGLIKAIENYNYELGFEFSTYAVPMIKGEVKRYIRDDSPVRISRSIKETAFKIINFKDEYLATHDKEPSTKEIIKFLGISEYEISNASLSLKDTMSISAPIYNDGGDTIYLEDQIEDKSEKREYDDLITLKSALREINKREKRILILRYMMGRTQTEIANDLGISQAQVSRLEKNATRSLRRFIK